MAEQQLLWHVVMNDKEQGPLTTAQVLGYLRSGTLAANDIVWRPGFPDWKPIRDVSDFDQAAARPSVARKWSLWRSADIGLLVSACGQIAQIAGGKGFQIADYASTASASTIAELIGEILAAPLVFVLIAVIRNLSRRRRPKSSASTMWGALIFVVLFASILGGMLIYGKLFFSRPEFISGETRTKFIADMNGACIQKQRSLNPDVTDTLIENSCKCISEKVADNTTYQQMTGQADAESVANLLKKIEAASNACR